MKKNSLLLIALLLVTGSFLYAETADSLWNQISGKWSVESTTKILLDIKSKPHPYGYSELINTNSIISISSLTKASNFYTEFELFSPAESSTGAFIFAAESYRSYYAFQLQGTKKGIQKAALLRCEVKDTTLPSNAKNNFLVTELASKEVSLEWGKPLKLSIRAKKKQLSIDINGTTIEYTMDSRLIDGAVGFSHANNLIRVRSVKVQSGDEVIFEDDFSKDRIKRATVNAVKVEKPAK